MNCNDAAIKSGISVAHRSKADGSLMFWDGEILWTQIAPGGHVKRLGGGHQAEKYNDWLSLYIDPPNHPQGVWMAMRGPIAPPEWKVACAEGALGRAMRVDKDDRLMVRTADGRTWLENRATNSLNLVTLGFRHYSGWLSMPMGHVLMTRGFGSDVVPFYNSNYPPDLIKDDPVQISQWALTGSCPALVRHLEDCKADIDACNAAVTKRLDSKCVKCLDTKRVSVPGGNGDSDSIPCPKCDPHDCMGFPVKGVAVMDGDHVTYIPKSGATTTLSQPDNQVLAALGPMATSLSDTIKVMAEIGEKDMAVKCAKQLQYLVSNSSWLLREDRSRWH